MFYPLSLYVLYTVPSIWYYSSFGQPSSSWCVNVKQYIWKNKDFNKSKKWKYERKTKILGVKCLDQKHKMIYFGKQTVLFFTCHRFRMSGFRQSRWTLLSLFVQTYCRMHNIWSTAYKVQLYYLWNFDLNFFYSTCQK